jgi:hypothetical protein
MAKARKATSKAVVETTHTPTGNPSASEDLQHTLRPLLRELERVYLETARFVGDGQIEVTHPLIVVQTRGAKKSRLGCCTPQQWTHGDNEDVTEISISAETLKRPVTQVLETLVHEMVHHANAVSGVKDCSKGGRHNKVFRDTAISFGLNVNEIPDKSKGYADTQLSPKLAAFLEELNVNPESFAYARNVINAKKKAPTRMLKWTCGCTIVRCATELDADCKECKNRFKVEAPTVV